MHKFYFLIISLIVITTANAQVLNVDRENGQDSIKKPVVFISSFDFSSDKQRNDFVELSTTNELDFFLKKNHTLILFNHLDAAFNGVNVIENNGYFLARFRDSDSRKVYPDFYTQYQWNGVLGMESRKLAGVNARIKVIEKKKIDLYASIGSFYENEIWNSNLSAFSFENIESIIVKRELLRLNLHTKIAFKLSEKIDFALSQYFQFPMNDSFANFTKFRWAFNSDIFFEVTDKIAFNIHYDHSIDNYRALPIDLYYYNLNIGINLTI